MSNSIDQRQIAALLKYDSLAALYAAMGASDERKKRYIAEHGLAPEVMRELMGAGLAFPLESMSHDQAIDRCFLAFKQIDKESIVSQFVVGIAVARADLRAGLPAYAIMKTMQAHRFQPSPAGACQVCSGVAESKYFDRTALNRQRFGSGSLAAFKTPYEIHFFLEQALSLGPVDPEPAHWALVQRILACINSTTANGPSDLIKPIRAIPGFKLNVDQTRGLVETLGLCGILSTSEHPGYDQRYTNPGTAPSKRHSSDWAYPVDFWTSKEGIRDVAVRSWFGSFGA